MKMKKFLKNIGIISIPLVIYLISIALIDPFNYLNKSNLVDASVKKAISEEVSPHMYKLLDYEHNPRGNILLGDSRSNTLSYSLDPSQWSNMTFGGGSMKEMIQAFWWVVERQELDTVLIGINLNLYNKNNKRFYVEQAIESLKNYISYSFNKNVFRSSFLIIKSSLSKKEVQLNKTSLSKEDFWEEHLNSFPKKYFSKVIYPEEYHSFLIMIADYCDQNDIKLIFWIPPTHIDYQNAIKKYNVDEMDVQFKSDLRSIGEVYDYNYPCKITEDKENFGDPVHFTYEIAVQIRDELLNGQIFCAKHSEKDIVP